MDTVITVSPLDAGKRLYELLLSLGHPFFAPCGGKGTCGKCRVELLEGVLLDAAGKPIVPDEKGQVLSCRAYISDTGCRVRLPSLSGGGLTAPTDSPFTASTRFDVALDIGTTTLAAALVDPDSGAVLKTASSLNPEAPFGADVMSRIVACREGKLTLMQSLLISEISSLMKKLIGEKGRISRLYAVGNPTMMHIFLGISPEGMGQYPFTPAFTSTEYRKGSALSLPCEEVVVLPCASAFIGSDVMAGAYYIGMAHTEKNVVLFDIGTNGEIFFSDGKRLYAASCAAGPALEGARISSGMGGVGGAVSSVRKVDGVYRYTTVEDKEAIGICGAGLCDLVAVLLDEGIIDEGGYLEDTYRLTGVHEAEGKQAPLAPTAVTLTAGDVRELQLAKSALRAGLETLLHEANATSSSLSALYLAGGLGYYLSPESARRIGMLSDGISRVIQPVGNAALLGAVKALCEDGAIEDIEALCRRVTTVDLNQSAVFSDLFMEYMFFPE